MSVAPGATVLPPPRVVCVLPGDIDFVAGSFATGDDAERTRSLLSSLARKANDD